MPPIDLHRNKIESLTMCLNSLKTSRGETGPPESMWPFHVEGSLPRKDAFEKAIGAVKEIIDLEASYTRVSLFEPDFFMRFAGCLQVCHTIDTVVEKIFRLLFGNIINCSIFYEYYKSSRHAAQRYHTELDRAKKATEQVKMEFDTELDRAKKAIEQVKMEFDGLKNNFADLKKSPPVTESVEALREEINALTEANTKLERELSNNKKELKRLKKASNVAKSLECSVGQSYGRKARTSRH